MSFFHWAMPAIIAAVAGFALDWSAVIVYGGICVMLLLRVIVVFLSIELGEEIP